MIGREEQLQQVLKHIESVLKSTTQENVLFITGEAGIGKSTFLKAVAEKATHFYTDSIVVTAQCSTPLAGQNIGEAEALKPWVDAADAMVRQNAEAIKNSEKTGFDYKEFFWETAPAWIELVPVVGSAIGAGVEIITTGYEHLTGNKKADKTVSSAISQQQIFQQYINLLLKISENSPLVIILDDFHWADDSSCNLLFAAARQLQQKPIILIIAYRPDDALTARDGEGHSILHIKNELERYDFSREVEVPKFSEENLDEFLREHYPNYKRDEFFEKWLIHEAGGNALFVIEFLKTLEEDHYIDKSSGVFTGNYDDVEIPKSAFAVIHERIRRLSDDAREFLQYASVEGETFTTSVLSQITELLPLKTLQRLRTIEDKHHIVKNIGKQILYSHETTAYQFAHALIHRAMYETLEDEERELLHKAILDIVKKEWNEAKESGKNLTGMVNRIAIHAELAKDYLFASEVLLKAAEARWKEFAESEAMQNITAAMNLLEKVEKESNETKVINAKLLHLRAKIHIYKLRLPKALDDLTNASKLYSLSNLESQMIDANFDISNVYAHQMKYEGAVEHIQEVLSKITIELTSSQKIRSLIGSLSINENQNDVIKKLTEILLIARQSGDQYDVIKVLEQLGFRYAFSKEYNSAIKYYEEGLRIAQGINDSYHQSYFLLRLGQVYTDKKEYEKAFKYYEDALVSFQRLEISSGEAICIENLGQLFKSKKNYEQAVEYFTKALEIYNRADDKYRASYVLQRIAQIYLEVANFNKAKEYAFKAKNIAHEIKEPAGIEKSELLLKEIDEAKENSERVKS